MKRMKTRPAPAMAVLCAIAAALAGSAAGAHAARAQADAGQPVVAAGQPGPVFDLQSAVRQTAAVVEGSVTDIHHDYSDADGPWTRVTLSGVKAHLGAAPQTIEIRHFGGPLPNGRMMLAAELPAFVKGKRYVVFLRNTSWNLSPVVGELALRAESVDGREVLVNSDGLVVTGVSKHGVEFGPALFGPLPLDGSAPDALGVKFARMARQPLEAGAFMQALAGAAAAQRVAVAGRFSATPAGEFKWRANPTSPAPGVRMPSAAATSEAAPEIDTTRPN